MLESNSRVLGYLEDSDMPKVKEDAAEHRKDDVLLFITEKGVSYPTEIAREVNLNMDTVNHILYSLKKLSFIDKIHPNHHNPQKMFRQRMQELWVQGIWGYDRISQMSWWHTTEGGVEYIKTKFRGQGKQIASSLARYLDLEVKDEDIR